MAGCDWAKSDDSISSIDLFEPREAAEKKESEKRSIDKGETQGGGGKPHTRDWCGLRAVGLKRCSQCKSCWFCDSECLKEG